jgi:hypothetical protein
MRRILLSCALLALLVLPATAGASTSAQAGFLVVQKGSGDGGVTGRPVVTVGIVKGFVLGRVSHQGRVDIFQLSANGQAKPQVKGADVAGTPIKWKGLTGTQYRGSNFRFRATGGSYRIVVRGSGIYLFAGGKGLNLVALQGSRFNPNQDGTYSVNGGTFRSLPKNRLTRKIS